jgi:hypothetical protein
MRRPRPKRTDRVPSLPAERPLNAEQLRRWAELIADGGDQFPTNLPRPAQDRLLEDVRRRRRERLVQHIALAIALHVRGAG